MSKAIHSKVFEQFGSIHPAREAPTPILSGACREAVHQWMIELQCENELKAINLKPRQTAMLEGPPGCGKTTLAHHLSARLGLPMVVIDMAAITGQYLHETGRQVGQLFAEARKHAREIVLFLDEFDAVAGKRLQSRGSGEADITHTTIVFLQQLDRFDGILLAATNRKEEIDPAIWRRFALQLRIEEPDDEARYAILTHYLSPLALPGEAMDKLCEVTEGASPALLQQMMEGVKRDLLLSPRFDRPTDPSSVIRRVIASVEPHEDARKPPLWDSTEKCLAIIGQIAWPPAMPVQAPAHR